MAIQARMVRLVFWAKLDHTEQLVPLVSKDLKVMLVKMVSTGPLVLKVLKVN
jgi:hypothetical protein